MTFQDRGGQGRTRLILPSRGQKRREVCRRDPNNPVNPVDGKSTRLDPAPDSPSGNAERIGNLRDREKAWRSNAGAFLVGIGHANPKSRSRDGTLINLRAPIFVHSISPL